MNPEDFKKLGELERDAFKAAIALGKAQMADTPEYKAALEVYDKARQAFDDQLVKFAYAVAMGTAEVLSDK